MFQRVTADNVAEGKDLLIGQFQPFRRRIGDEACDEISRACIPTRIEDEQEHDENQRPKLHEKV